MNFKLLDLEKIIKIYPNRYDTNVLKSYSLMDVNLNTTYRYFFSCYKFYFEKYIASKLNLQNLDIEIEKLNLLPRKEKSIYQDISTLGLKYIFIRNNIFLDRLEKAEFETLKNAYNKQDIEGIQQLVINTYSNLIKFDKEIPDSQIVNYDATSKTMIACANNALLIGIDFEIPKNDKALEELQQIIRKQEREYSEILKIPVSIYCQNANNMIENSKKIFANSDPLEVLPIGSIVQLDQKKKKIMITGYVPVSKEKKIYDYLGCLYPEGLASSKSHIAFNKEDITSIVAIGPIDSGVSNILKRLTKFDKEIFEKKL